MTGIELIAPECKEYGKLKLLSADMEQAEANARKVGKDWALFIKEKAGQGNKCKRVVVMDYYAFIDLYNKAVAYDTPV